MTSLDVSIMEAAKVDGATEFQTNIYIVLPLMKKEKTGAINWGFVAGKTNTIFAWDEVIPSGEETELWFHDIYRSNGVPFQQEEVDCIKSLKNGVSGKDFFLMNIYFQWFLFLISVF